MVELVNEGLLDNSSSGDLVRIRWIVIVVEVLIVVALLLF